MRDWRSGSLRECRPGAWEMRIAVATGPIAGRAIQQSFTFHGDWDTVEARRSELAADYATIFGITDLIRTPSLLKRSVRAIS